jgi:FMN phosphatase YigB (HAD superfamily)
MTIKWVIFDIGGVLAHDTFNELLEKILIGENVKTKTDTKIFNSIMKSADNAWKYYKVGEIDEEEFFGRIVDGGEIGKELVRLGYVNSEDKVILIQYLKRTLRDDILQLLPDTIKFANILKSQGRVKIGILSNHSKEWIHELFHLENGLLPQVFDDQRVNVISDDPDVKSAKPDREVYEALMRRLRIVDPSVTPNQVIFIDDKSRNTTTAEEFGLHTILFDARKQNVKNDLVPAIKRLGVTID